MKHPLLSLSFLLSALLAATAQDVQAVPNDSFYDPPTNLSDYNYGDVIRRRSIQQKFWQKATIKEIIQVQYKTRLTSGEDSWSISTVLVPSNPGAKKQLYSYQVFEDAVQLDCAPSWTIKNGILSPGFGGITNAVADSIEGQVDQGRYVVVPDHEGAESAFFGGRQEGYAGLDGIRAAINAVDLPKDTGVVIFGYSGGAHATAWMVNQWESYAKDINLIGAAYGGTLVDAYQQIVYDDHYESLVKGSVASLIAGLLVAYPDVNSSLWSHITPDIQTAIVQMRIQPGGCDSAAFLTNFQGTVRAGINVNLSSFEPTKRMFQQETLLANLSSIPIPAPKFPRYIYHGSADEVAPYELIKEYVDEQESKGANITFKTYDGYGHVQTAFNGLQDAENWINSIFASN